MSDEVDMALVQQMLAQHTKEIGLLFERSDYTAKNSQVTRQAIAEVMASIKHMESILTPSFKEDMAVAHVLRKRMEFIQRGFWSGLGAALLGAALIAWHKFGGGK